MTGRHRVSHRDRWLELLAWLSVIAFGVIAGAALYFSASARADTTEQNFLEILRANGITFDPQTKALAAGHAICADLFNGLTQKQESATVQRAGFPPKLADLFVSQAIAAFCPSQLKDWA